MKEKDEVEEKSDEEEDDELDECLSCGKKVKKDEGVETLDRKSGELLAVMCDECWND